MRFPETESLTPYLIPNAYLKSTPDPLDDNIFVIHFLPFIKNSTEELKGFIFFLSIKINLVMHSQGSFFFSLDRSLIFNFKPEWFCEGPFPTSVVTIGLIPMEKLK